MPTHIPAAERTLAVFEIFAREKRELSNSEMARLLDVAESSSSDLLFTLHSLGYLMRTPRTRRFYPTARMFEAARRIAENDPLSGVAREAVEQLVDKTNESAFFGVLEADAVKVVATQASRNPLRYILEVGERVAAHASALGKSLLGLLPPEALAPRVQGLRLGAVTPRTITSAKALIADIERQRQLGWYEATGEGTDGVSGLAVSGWLGDQAVAVSLAGPTERVQSQRGAYVKALEDVRGALLGGG
ncbi:MAG: IclR family transcriptional regulator [Proteobacteria bacterium]|nr:IclR family transcriptional regulator [Pseudomonadota bacterium]